MTTEQTDGAAEQIAYPPSPWHMVGQQWLTVFRLARDVDELRPAGIYGAAWVRYEEGSPLTYSELLVARAARSAGAGRRVSITDIWVDSPASVAGGRDLWAIPKGLCDFTYLTGGGLVQRTSWTASLQGAPIAAARFTDAARVMPRVPFRGSTWQPPIDDHTGPATAVLQGSGKALPGRAHWDFAADGPLGWMREARQLATFRLVDFRMSFG